ncbi:MAG: Phosphate transporter, periplasmic phosphate-binding protein PstS [Acidobacteria bacterium]|nr:Phosphate transporter, periplasmic phosphate-binding protein PstS [Acidobacteriota bacterium]
MKRSLPALLLLVAFVCSSCKFAEDKKARKTAEQPGVGAATKPSGHVAIKGSDAMKALTEKLVKGYGADGAAVQGGGSSIGFAALQDGSADIAAASRPASPEERAAIEAKRGAPLVETPVAYDVVTIYVNSANPVVQLSLPQLAGIVNGSIKNWNQAGGPNAPIVLYGQGDAAGFTAYLGAAPLAPHPARDYADARGVIAAVAADPAGIGYASLIPTTQARTVWIQREAGGIAVAPAEKTVLDRSYPLSSRFYFYSPANASAPTKAFLAWLRSAPARKTIESAGYVPGG